jgi:hypothetical protein
MMFKCKVHNKGEVMKHLKTILIAMMTVSLAGCSSHRIASEAKSNPTFIAYMQATKRLEELVRAGNVPGFSMEDHGKVLSKKIRLSNKSPVEYPMQVSLQVDRNREENAKYWVVLEKTTADSEWELVEVWKTDERAQNGHFLLKVPSNADAVSNVLKVE